MVSRTFERTMESGSRVYIGGLADYKKHFPDEYQLTLPGFESPKTAERFVITTSAVIGDLHPYLSVCTMTGFSRYTSERIENSSDPERLARLLYSNSEELLVDDGGRISLSPYHKEFLGIAQQNQFPFDIPDFDHLNPNKVVLNEVNRGIKWAEIWNKKEWEKRHRRAR